MSNETIPVRFDVLHTYAETHRLDYNELCCTVREAIATGSADAAERIYRLEEAVANLLILTDHTGLDKSSAEMRSQIRRARWAIGAPRLKAQLEAIGRLK